MFDYLVMDSHPKYIAHHQRNGAPPTALLIPRNQAHYRLRKKTKSLVLTYDVCVCLTQP